MSVRRDEYARVGPAFHIAGLTLLFGLANATPYAKDAFREFLVRGDHGAINPDGRDTKAAFRYVSQMPPASAWQIDLRLSSSEHEWFASGRGAAQPFADFQTVFDARIRDAEEFYSSKLRTTSPETTSVARQAFAGLL